MDIEAVANHVNKTVETLTHIITTGFLPLNNSELSIFWRDEKHLAFLAISTCLVVKADFPQIPGQELAVLALQKIETTQIKMETDISFDKEKFLDHMNNLENQELAKEFTSAVPEKIAHIVGKIKEDIRKKGSI